MVLALYEEILRYIVDNFLAIAAIVIAALSLYLHHRRPLERVEIRKRHSDELKEEIKRWISNMIIEEITGE